MHPSIYLHIGTHKTGTTSLQRFFHANRGTLLEHGVLYPEAGRSERHRRPTAHHELAWSVRGMYGAEDERPWDKMMGEVRKLGIEKIVISSEVFSRCVDHQVQCVSKYLDGFPTTVILYLRNQFDFMVSSYKEQVKTGKYAGTFRQFLVERKDRCDYEDLVRCWVENFPKARIVIRWFDLVRREPGLERDFLHIVGVDTAGFEEAIHSRIPINVSPSDEAISMMRIVNLAECRIRIVPKTSFQRARHALHRCNSPVVKLSMLMARPFISPLASEADKLWLREAVREWDAGEYADKYA